MPPIQEFGSALRTNKARPTCPEPPMVSAAAGSKPVTPYKPSKNESDLVHAAYLLESHGLVSFGTAGQMKCIYEQGVRATLVSRKPDDRKSMEELAAIYKVPVRF